MKVAVPCSLCGASKLRTPSVATKAVGYILVCSACERRGLRPELVTKSSITWTHEINLLGGFTGWKPYEPPSPGSRDDRVAMFDDGQMVEIGTPQQVFDSPVQARTKAFLFKVL